MNHLRSSLAILAAAVLLPACKSPTPEFGFPDDDGSGGWFSRQSRDDRADNWHKKRSSWSKREDEKFDRMFDRIKGDY